MPSTDLHRDTWTWGRLAAAYALTLGAVLARLLPHPPNMHLLIGAGLYGAVRLPKTAAVTVPLAAVIISDAIIGLHSTVAWTWGAFLLVGILGLSMRTRVTTARIATASTLGAIVFYVVTNFGVWWVQDLYPKTPAGLTACYVAALPFFRNTLCGAWLSAAALFGADALGRRWAATLAQPSIARQ